MTTVALILPTATYRAADFLEAADALDLDVVIVSERRQSLADAMGDHFLEVDLDEPRAAARTLATERPNLDAVFAVDDAGVVTAALAAQSLGLPHNPPQAVAATRNKASLRRALNGVVPQPRFGLAEADDDGVALAREIGVPAVVKPLSLSGSRGVIRVDDPEQMPSVMDRIRLILARAGVNPSEPLLVERFAPGTEVAVEAILRDGTLDVLAVFDKPDPLDGPFFEETIYVTPSRFHPEVLDEVIDVTTRAAAALGLVVGPVHAELRVDGPTVRLIELAARPIGGLCSRALRFGLLGTSLETVLLRAAAGLPARDLRRETEAAGIMMLPIPKNGTFRGLGRMAEAQAVLGITGLDVTIPRGKRVEALPEGDRYLGFLFARAPEPGQVEEALRTAYGILDTVIE